MTEEIQTHFFTESVTETLNSDKSDSNQCWSQNQQQPIVPIHQYIDTLSIAH